VHASASYPPDPGTGWQPSWKPTLEHPNIQIDKKTGHTATKQDKQSQSMFIHSTPNFSLHQKERGGLNA